MTNDTINRNAQAEALTMTPEAFAGLGGGQVAM